MATFYEAFQKRCKAKGQWGLYLSGGHDDPKEAVKAAPCLKGDEKALKEGLAERFFEYEADCRKAFKQVVGDDGPGVNPYDGPARWYALVVDASGNLVTENT